MSSERSPAAPSAVVYLEDRFVAPEDARVSMFDRGYLFGDSVFETLRTYRGVAFRLAEHLAHFERAAGLLGIALPAPQSSRVALSSLVREAIARCGLDETYVRITLSRGEGPPGIGTANCTRPIFSIVARPLHRYPATAYEVGIRSAVVATRKVPAACLNPSIKTGNYLPNIMARRELEQKGLVEGIQLAIDGAVVSGCVSNVFLVQGRRLRTPALATGCRPGVTREAVLALAPALGLEVAEERIEPADLFESDELFFTNTLMECLPVASLDDHAFGRAPGPVGSEIRRAFEALVAAETQRDADADAHARELAR